MAWQNAVQRQLRQWYSEAAVRQGLQGEVLVFFLLDEEGNVTAARIEQSSGHALLDADAVQAVRQLRGLPSGTPREVLLPLRFRLKD